MNATTAAIVKDGQTVMLGGILFQKDTLVERKLPLVGDIPLVGALFRHYETLESNTELIVFITPEVVDEEDLLAETKKAEEKMESMLGKVQNTSGKNKVEEEK
jgi:type II secretory pathway component GspD/PulD (secretin)